MSLTDKETRLVNICSYKYPELAQELLEAKVKMQSKDSIEPEGELQNFKLLIISAEDFLKLADDDFDNPTISLADLINTKPTVRVEKVVDFLHRWTSTFHVRLHLGYQYHTLNVHTAGIITATDWKPQFKLVFDLFNTFKHVKGMDMNEQFLRINFTYG